MEDYFKKLEDYIVERTADVEFGCLMVYFDIPNWKEILEKVNIDVKDVHRYGLEKEPHVTVLYGFHLDKVNKNDIKKEIEKLKIKPFKIKLSKITQFQNKEYDVLKFDIENETLKKLNKHFGANFPYTNDFPEYNPHMTVGYVLPGSGKKYLGKDFSSIEVDANKFVYSEKADAKNRLEILIK